MEAMEATETGDEPWAVKAVESWAEAKAVFDSLQNTWIFRGQGDASYALSPSLERRILSKVRGPQPPDQLLALERMLTKSFMRSTSLHYTSGQAPSDTLGWWAEMQHYGMPTRLLDFTWSPYVASYFAMEDGAREGDRAVWALGLESPTQPVGQVKGHSVGLDAFVAETFGDEARAALHSGAFWEEAAQVDAFLEAAQTQRLRAVLAVQTDRMNERMLGQQGLFVMPSSLDVGFAACLAGSGTSRRGAPATLVKIVLPGRTRLDVLYDLMRMNVTRVSLFPGLEGMARTLGDNFERALEADRLQLPASGLE
jgi:FRG domain